MELKFITYINRSGSTYLAQILSISKEILVCPEADILVEKYLEDPEAKSSLSGTERVKIIKELNDDWKFKHWNISQEELESVIGEPENLDIFLSILNLYKDKIKPDASRILFKAERIIYLWNRLTRASRKGDLLHLIALIRDPRGTFASQKNTRWPGSERPFSDNPVHAGILWKSYLKELFRLMKVHSNITMIRFEDILKNPEKSLERLSEIMHIKGIPFSPGDGDYYSRIPSDQKQIHSNIIFAPIKEKENDWKNILDQKEIDLIQCVTRRYVKKAGYKMEERKAGLIILLKTLILQTVCFYFNFYANKISFWINKIING